MLNRTCRNQVELNFCKADEREDYHRAALAKLLLHARSHPLTGDRLAGASRTDILHDPQEILAHVAPVRTPDHGNAVLAARDVSGPGGASIVFSTGGTTGRPVILLNTWRMNPLRRRVRASETASVPTLRRRSRRGQLSEEPLRLAFPAQPIVSSSSFRRKREQAHPRSKGHRPGLAATRLGRHAGTWSSRR